MGQPSNQIVETVSVTGVKKLAEWCKKNPAKSAGLALAFLALCAFGYAIT